MESKTGGQNNAVTKFMKKLGLGGPRFVRNVNLAYVRDPFAVKGTTYRPTECSYNGFYALCAILSFLFVWTWVRETKGISLEDMQGELADNRATRA